MAKIFASPSHYVQGKNVLFDRIDLVKQLGNKILLLADDTVWKIVGEKYASELKKEGLDVYREAFNGEASENEIKRVVNIGKEKSSNVVIGLGGGKAIDSAKAIAEGETIHAMIEKPTAEDVVDAIKAVDSYVRNYFNK